MLKRRICIEDEVMDYKRDINPTNSLEEDLENPNSSSGGANLEHHRLHTGFKS